MGDHIEIDWGEDAAARSSRSIIMMVDAAIECLTNKGYRRLEDRIEIDMDLDDPLPTYLKLRGRRVFQVEIVVDEFISGEGKIMIRGRWLHSVPARGWWRRLMFWRDWGNPRG